MVLFAYSGIPIMKAEKHMNYLKILMRHFFSIGIS